MPKASEENTPPTPEEFLSSIHAGLKDASVQTRLESIQKLNEQSFSNLAVLRTLEEIVIKDKSKSVREAALKALSSPAHRYIQRKTVKLSPKERQTLLDEIQNWETQGIIQHEQANVLRQRYDFDLKAATPQPVSAPPWTPDKPATTKEVLPPPPKSDSPRPGLTQSLLSETSIKIALYLGAFFVIAAAAILAAVVEAARMPILLAATALFAGGAIITRPRLSQPSFALFVVFSFLLPTDANVLADMLDLSGKANAGYWFAVMAIMALIWSFGTWFYASRLFSLAAFVALLISFARLGELLESEPEIYLLSLSFATLIGLGGTFLLKRWRTAKFSLPLFILVQLSHLGLIALAIVTVALRTEDIPSTWNLASSAFWLLALIFYVLSDLIFPFILFPWLAVAALYPLPVNVMLTFDIEALQVAIAIWFWGFGLAAASEILRRRKINRLHLYGWASLIGSFAVLLTSILIGYVEDISYGFAFILGAALIYALLHILKPRVYVWTTSLLLGLGAYFTFFTLPSIKTFNVFNGYQLLGASLLLLVSDLFLTPNFSTDKIWRWPLRILGAFLAFINLSLILPYSPEYTGHAALAYGIYTIFFAIYAFRFGKALLGYLATASAALGILFALQYFELDTWLLTLTALSLFYYIIGFILSRKDNKSPWSNMLRYSGLALASLVVLWALVTVQENSGGYLLIAAALFGVEMYAYNSSLAEAGIQLFLASGVFMLLRETDLPRAYHWLGIALVILGTDLMLALTYPGKRPIAWFSRGLGALFVALNTFDVLLSNSDSQITAICFVGYMLFFLAQSLLYRQPLLGYSFSLYSVLTTIFLLRIFDQLNWMLPVTLLAIIYYAAGYFLRKRKPANVSFESETPTILDPAFSWPFVLWTSGLGVGLITTTIAPLQGGLAAAIPPAILATMVTIEAFDRRNIWLGFPANIFYLMAYFILLIELNVDEPQFFSIATAALGLLMHYLLTRTDSRTGAFITGMVSQLVLLSTTYIQFLSTERLVFFAILFFQALIVLGYGVVIRSRSLVITPLVFLVLSVLTVLYGLMQGIMAVVLIGCTGLLLLMLGILAVILRDRLKQISERFSDWGA